MIILVMTYDRRAATWPVVCYGIKKYWPDCPWPTVFTTNRLGSPCGQAIKTGDDTNWSEMMRRALRTIESKGILLLNDDYWLCAPVDTGPLLEFADIVEGGDVDYIQVNMSRMAPGWREYPPDPRLYIKPDKEEYRASLQAALWRSEALLSLLRGRESAIQFETTAGRSRCHGTFLGTKRDYIRYAGRPDPDWEGFHWGPVMRGKWTRTANEYGRREGIKIDFEKLQA